MEIEGHAAADEDGQGGGSSSGSVDYAKVVEQLTERARAEEDEQLDAASDRNDDDDDDDSSVETMESAFVADSPLVATSRRQKKQQQLRATTAEGRGGGRASAAAGAAPSMQPAAALAAARGDGSLPPGTRLRGARVAVAAPATVVADSHVELLVLTREAVFSCTSFESRQRMRDFAIKQVRCGSEARKGGKGGGQDEWLGVGVTSSREALSPPSHTPRWTGRTRFCCRRDRCRRRIQHRRAIPSGWGSPVRS
jgi:hypothetical protein